jgi:hypothetical protein
LANDGKTGIDQRRRREGGLTDESHHDRSRIAESKVCI